MNTTNKTDNLQFIFTENDFYLNIPRKSDDETDEFRRQFEQDRYRALYQMGFDEPSVTPSAGFLRNVEMFHPLRLTAEEAYSFLTDTEAIEATGILCRILNWWKKILARVQETRKTPYKVEIQISPLSEEKCQTITEKCGRKLENMEKLLAGNFPENMQELFQGKDGLFPSPKEISFSCSCPDWALMCKHVAAALYGVGVRLDEQPLLFFELRGIDVGRFIDVALANKAEAMLANEGKASKRIMDVDSAEISELFGVL